ncbi:MAG: cytochrome-c peroxidase [Sulfitobacter sp.]
MRLFFAALVGGMMGASVLAGPLPPAATDADFHQFPAELVELGRDLFFDPILSGNKNIACATCHHPSLGTSDAMSLSIGEGGLGLGAQRRVDGGNRPLARIPRNAPALFNLGAKEFKVMFHDGRLAEDRNAMFGIRMPDGRTLERPMPSALSAQTLLPILSPDEMSGHPGENDIADAVDAERIHGPDGAWALLTARVADIPEYTQRFAALGRNELHITDIGQALGAFIGSEFRATQSPFDAFLEGDSEALSDAQLAGMELFYGKARCSTCHSGTFQTDHEFYALGLPQFGPGKKAPHMAYADTGLGMVSGSTEDTYRFRTPTLRNVTQSGPYGHNGAYARLEDMVRHHLRPVESLAKYNRNSALLPGDMLVNDDWEAMDDMEEVMRIAEAVEIIEVTLEDSEFDKIMAFLKALEDPDAGKRGLGAPQTVPSGLPVDVPGAPS